MTTKSSVHVLATCLVACGFAIIQFSIYFLVLPFFVEIGSVKIVLWILGTFLLAFTSVACLAGCLSVGLTKMRRYMFDQSVLIAMIISTAILLLCINQSNKARAKSVPLKVLDAIKKSGNTAMIVPLDHDLFSISLPQQYKPKWRTSFAEIESSDITTASLKIGDTLYRYPCIRLFERFVILKPQNPAFVKYISIRGPQYVLKDFVDEFQDLQEAYHVLEQKFPS